MKSANIPYLLQNKIYKEANNIPYNSRGGKYSLNEYSLATVWFNRTKSLTGKDMKYIKEKINYYLLRKYKGEVQLQWHIGKPKVILTKSGSRMGKGKGKVKTNTYEYAGRTTFIDILYKKGTNQKFTYSYSYIRVLANRYNSISYCLDRSLIGFPYLNYKLIKE